MTTFTARELDRQTGKVLETCDNEGAVLIRRKNGRSYRISSETHPGPEESLYDWMLERRRRTKELFRGQPPLTKKQARLVDRMIAGE